MQGPYIPLREGSKAPAVSGWAHPDYEGVEPEGRVGQRCDGLVVIDCDSDEAKSRWIEHVGRGSALTRINKTPRGWHFIYRWTPGSPEGPAVGVFDGTDVRAGRGSYIVVPPTEGYSLAYDPEGELLPFDPRWLPDQVEQKAKLATEVIEHDGLVPGGARSDYMTSLAGRLREAGHTTEQIAKLLARANETLLEFPLEREELVQLLRQVDRWEQGEKPLPEIQLDLEEHEAGERLLSARNMTPPDPPKWWWDPYIPSDRLVMLDGQEGIGKGMMSAWMAAHVTRGTTPDGERTAGRNVLWLSAEDDPRDDVLRRLLAQQWTAEHDGDVLFWNLGWYWPRFPRDRDMLSTVIRNGNIGMVVLDPGRSFLGPPDEMDRRDFSFNDESSVRPGMESLGRIAKDTSCSVIFVHHHNKRSKRDASTRERMGGSIAFLQVVRHRVTMSELKDGRRAFAVEKSNIAPTEETVYEYQLLAAPEEHTVRFQLSRHRPEFLSLGEWERSEEEVHLDPAEGVLKALEGCDERTVLPGPRKLLEVSNEALGYTSVAGAKRVYDALVGAQVLEYVPGRGYVVGVAWPQRWSVAGELGE